VQITIDTINSKSTIADLRLYYKTLTPEQQRARTTADATSKCRSKLTSQGYDNIISFIRGFGNHSIQLGL